MIAYTLIKDGIEETRHVKTSWDEVTLAEYVPIASADSPLEAACRLCGLTIEEYALSGDVMDVFILDALEMVATGPEIKRPEWLPADFAHTSIGRFELAKKHLLAVTEHHVQAFPYFYAIYRWPKKYDLLDCLVDAFPVDLFWEAAHLPVTEVIGTCEHVLAELQRITDKYAPVLDVTLTAEQIAAGVDRFEKFGFYPTLLNYAAGDLTRLASVLEVKVGTFFYTLWVDTERAEYEQQYHQIITKKH